MRASTAFIVGILCGKLLLDLAGAVAASDTKLGEEVRRKLLGRKSLDRLMRIESEVTDEINRRVRTMAEK